MGTAQVVFCTCPDEQVAQQLSASIVSEQLAACVNIVPGVRSIYRWKGELCDDAEALMIIKTTTVRFAALKQRLLELHPYDCPEVIAMDIRNGSEPYLEWLHTQTEDEPSA